MDNSKQEAYSNPDVLVSTQWVSEHLHDPAVRIIESNEDRLLYFSGHIGNAVHVDWATDLNDQVKRDYINKEQFEKLMSRIGVTPNTTLVFYGDKSNWWACYSFWVFQFFGHKNAKLMNGGRLKWEKENRGFTKEIPEFKPTVYKAMERDERRIRAFRDDVLKHIFNKRTLIDVRSLEEYTGQRLHMPDYPNEGALRGGHIPGAKSVPWSTAVNTEDGTFKSPEELYDIYGKKLGLKTQDDIITYCRIGERSSHTWFVLTYLLGYKNVRNYDGSWTEWGNLVNVPIEK
jgi:thiosulfate/3-mercaptopyruvate sulfurtransferase